jgi:hypothetical protein
MAINFKQLKGKVEYCLIKYPDACNYDQKLCNAILVEFYNDSLFKIEEQYAIKLIDFYKLPKFEDICRIRRKFNQQGMYLATDEKVKEERLKKEINFRKNLGYNPEFISTNNI